MVRGPFPWRYNRTLPLRPERMLVATKRCIEYIALSTGCRARRAFLTGLGVMARLTARPGCTARRTHSLPLELPGIVNALLVAFLGETSQDRYQASNP